MSDADLKTMTRVMSHVVIDPVTHCWTWTGSFRNSYPVFSFYPEELPSGVAATRAIRPWLFQRGNTGSRSSRKHLDGTPACNNPKCVNPEHMRYKSGSGRS